VFTLEQLVSYLGCSAPTARLRLKKWKSYTSYNKNGRYYSLHTVPRFDENGLWHYEHIFFSKSGNLKKTLIYLVQRSPSGLTGKEIGDLVGLPPRSFLHHFRNTAGIYREKIEGLYIYFSDDPGRYQRQTGNRSTLIVYQDKLFSDADDVIILTALATYTLIHWLFEAPHPSKGYGFPFERPHLAFYERLKKVHGLLTNITYIYLRDKSKDNRSFIQVLKLLEEVLGDKELKESAADG